VQEAALNTPAAAPRDERATVMMVQQ